MFTELQPIVFGMGGDRMGQDDEDEIKCGMRGRCVDMGRDGDEGC